MKTPSGMLHVVDFKTEQIISVIQAKNYWDDKRHWEIKNNVDTLDFKVNDNTDHAVTLIQQNLVLKEVRDGRIVPYVITEIEKNSDDRSVTVYASGAWIQIAKSGIIHPQKIESKTLNEFVDMALVGTEWKRGRTEYAGFHSMTIDEFIDPLKFLKDIASLFDLEIQYRVTVVGSQIVGWYVDMVKKRGRETGKEVVLGKDLGGIKRIENSQNICTALVGFVKGEGDQVITVESINNGLTYIVDSDAFQRWNDKGKHKFGLYTPETEDLNMSPQRLMTLMKAELKKRVNASVSYEVEARSIGRIFGIEHELINEGDTIYIKDTGFKPKLYLEARVIAGDESFTDPTQDKYVFGDYRDIVDPNEEFRKMYNKILGLLGDKANKELLEQLEKLAEEALEQSKQAEEESKIAKDIAEKVMENQKNFQTTIIKSTTAPTENLEVNKSLWLDIGGGEPGILKLWDGQQWNSIVPDTTGLEAQIDDTRKEVDDFKNSIGDIPDTEWVKKQVEGKANKEDTYTKEWVNKNLIGKQVYDVDKAGNIKSMEDLRTDVDRNAEEISSKASKTELKQADDKVVEAIKTVNEVKQTAEENSSRITQINGRFDNMTDEFTKTTNEIKQTVEENSSTVEQVRKDTDSMQTTVSEIKQTTNEISSKVSDITKVQTDQGEVLANHESKITQNSQQISSKVSSNEMREYVGGLGTQNMVLNSQFTTRILTPWGTVEREFPSLQNWRPFGTMPVKAVGDVKLEGNNSVRINTMNMTNFAQCGIEQLITLQGQQHLVASVYGFAKSSQQPASVTMEVKFAKNGNFAGYADKQLTFTSNIWKITFFDMEVPLGADSLTFKIYADDEVDVWVAEPMLQVGKEPSSFMPHPKDLIDYNDTISKIADKISTEEFNKVTTKQQTEINQTREQIDLRASKTEVYTRTQSDGRYADKSMVIDMEAQIKVNANEISQTVRRGQVISSINQSAEKIKISADLIDLVGKVEASWLKAGLLQGMTIKTSNTNEYIHMQNQVLRFVNQGRAKITIGFEDERQSKTFNPYIILGEGDGAGRNFGSIYKDGNGVYYRYVDQNGAESNLRLTAQGNVGITAQTSMWLNSNGSIVLDGRSGVSINSNGRTVANLKAANGGGDCDLNLGNHTIRSSTVSGYDKLLQIKNSYGNDFRGIEVAEVTAHGGIRSDTNLWAEQNSYAMQHINRSTVKLKTSVHDLPFSALEKVRELKVKQYFLKRDMYELYQMRMNKQADQIKTYTTNDIETQYGFIAEETDDIFTTTEKDGIKLYTTVSILTAALQELDDKHNAEVAELNGRIESLEALVQKLVDNKKDGQAEQQ